MTPPESITLTGALQLEAVSKSKPARLRIVAYTGGTIRVPGFSRPVIVDLAALTAPASVPILDGHANSLDAIIGSGDVENDGRTLTVTGRLADTDVAAKVRALLQSGVPLQASIGASVQQSRDVRPGETLAVNKRQVKADAPLTLVERAELREVSIVALGADGETEVSIAAAAARKESNMEGSELEAARAEERARLGEIDTLCRNLDGPRVAELRASAIAGDLTLDALRAGLLEHVRSSRPRAPVPAGDVDVGGDKLLSAAVLLTLGRAELAAKHYGERAAQAAADLKCRHVLDLFAHALMAEGRAVPAGRDAMIRAAFSTVSLPTALGASAEKIALDAYRASPATWRAFSRVVPLRNFRQHPQIRLSVARGFEQVGPTGELKHGTLEEGVYNVQADTHGMIFGLSRQHIINDDLGLLMEIPTVLGQRAATSVADSVYRELLSNPDSFFSEAHGNHLAGAANAIGLDSLAAAVKVMRLQTDEGGRPIDVPPAVVVVPPSLETHARSLLVSQQFARDVSSADGLPMGSGLPELRLEVESRLENESFPNASGDGWYLFSRPDAGAVSVGFIDGNESPTVETLDPDPDKLGLVFRGFLDYGVALGDWRAAVFADPNA